VAGKGDVPPESELKSELISSSLPHFSLRFRTEATLVQNRTIAVVFV
jgi:hypothetical protein